MQNHSTMAIKLCKVSIMCFVMYIYKMFLTISFNCTLTSSLLLHIIYIYNRFLIIIRDSAATEYCFSMLHPVAIFYSSTASTPYVNKTFVQKHEQFLLNPFVQPKAIVLVIDSSHAGVVDVTGTSSPAFRAHPLVIWRYLRFVDVGTLVN